MFSIFVAADVRIQVMMRHKLLATQLTGAVLVSTNMGIMVMMKMGAGGNTCVSSGGQYEDDEEGNTCSV